MARPESARSLILRLGPGIWADFLRTCIELAMARRALGRNSGRDLVRLARSRRPRRPAPAAARDAIIQRVAFIIPRVAGRVPWRADCFVQALAAQSWLARAGVESDLFIGVPGHSSLVFEAHAWLKCGEYVVTGGDVTGFVPLLTPDTPLHDSDYAVSTSAFRAR